MRLLTIALTVALATFIVDGALADTFRFDANGSASGNWNTGNNWWNATQSSRGNVPDTDDDTEILTGKTCTLDTDDQVLSLDVQGTATFNTGQYDLTLTASGALQLSSTSAVLNIDDDGVILCSGLSTATEHTIHGKVYLKDDGSVLKFSDSGHITGYGAIRGEHSSATIKIAADKTLTSFLATGGITGALQIIDDDAGDGSFFENQGIVDADYSGETLLIDVRGDDDTNKEGLTDTDIAKWRCSCGGKLEFGANLDEYGEAIELDGDFFLSGTESEMEFNASSFSTEGRLKMSGGLMDVNQSIEMGTTGDKLMEMTGGTIDVAPSMTFTHN